jgi:hypothetical protein
MDAGAPDAALPPDAAMPVRLDAARDTATPTRDAAAPTPDGPVIRPAFLGRTFTCDTLVSLPESDTIAHFFDDFGVVRTLPVADRMPAATARLFNDGSGGTEQATIVSEARCDSSKSARYNGGGFKLWGSALQLDFVGPTFPSPTYDATRYKGVRFFARATTATSLRVKFPDLNTARWGGVCNQGDGSCDDHWGRDITVATEWRVFELLWRDLDLTRANLFGRHLLEKLYGIEFLVRATPSFDVRIDDIAFIP